MRVRRFVVSDVHGHLADLRSALRRRGLLDSADRWCDPDAELWVLGDLLDRGPDGVGVIDLLRGLQEQAPDRVHVLLGNHEVLAIGAARWPTGRFGRSWSINGGRVDDQAALDEERLAWLAGLPAMGRAGDFLLVHSDTTAYADWGASAPEVNARVRAELAADDEERTWAVWSKLCGRLRFTRADGAAQARAFLQTFGGRCLVHGHTIVGSLLHERSSAISGPLLYAEDQVLAIDGGRYDDGPLLVVPLD
ncbi:metallophosphoesterase [Nocardioides massiliensis]|uniref:Calcineurin-like phosphoesterase domain-containing protein n=1 Tax=Nocardioides massiliensis TaxID=1325935 RepID=A0ABT9NSB9_9ACTN|nr:metallophosphoesterase [Nocardioides massiliensis]MDP9822725.1 hypothetical protein [Nocardioides massiliensis]